MGYTSLKRKCYALQKEINVFFVILYLSVIGGCVIVDQVTKLLAENGKSFQVFGSFLGVHYTKNSGMAYGLLADWKYAQLLFALMTIIILVAVLIFLLKTTNRSKCLHTSIAFIVGGTLGNFIDRLALNYVRDFILLDLRVSFLQFNCNPADVFITIGAVLFVVYCLFLDKEAIFKSKKNKEE